MIQSSDGQPAPTLEVVRLSKSYGPVRALDAVDFSLFAGEVLGLLGDNGAGKSTLVKCLSGVTSPDSGHVFVDGREVQTIDAQHARSLGIETVHQGLSLVPTLSVSANLFLNRERTKDRGIIRWLGWLAERQMQEESRSILAELQINMPSVRQPVSRLSGGQRQAVAVGRAVAWGRHIVLMDEPAAALGVEQAKHVNDLIHRLRDRGVAVLLISHNMQHVAEVCDRAVVLRHGRKVADVAIDDVSARDLVDLITGAREGAG